MPDATLRALNLEMLCKLTVDLARLGPTAPEVPDADVAELPDLGSGFHVEMTWNALTAE